MEEQKGVGLSVRGQVREVTGSSEQRVAENFLHHLTGLNLVLDFHGAEYTDPYGGFLESFAEFEVLPPMFGIPQGKGTVRVKAPIEQRKYPQKWIGVPTLLFVYNPGKGTVDILCIDPILTEEWEGAEKRLERAQLLQDNFGQWHMKASWLKGGGNIQATTYNEFREATNNLGSRWIMYQSPPARTVA